MDEGRDLTRRGNETFIRGDFPEAIEEYKEAYSLSVDEGNRNDAVANGLKAELSLGFSCEHSHFFKCFLKPLEYPSQPSHMPRTGDREIDDLLREGKLSEALFHATLAIDHDNWNSDAFFSRAKCYHRLGDYASALHDLETVEALNPHGDKHWKWIAETAVALNQEDLLQDAIKQGQKRGLDMFLYQCIHTLRANKLKELAQLCQKLTLPCNPRLLAIRMQMNIQLGNYKMAWNDAMRLEDVPFPWLMFFQDRLPMEWTFDKHAQSKYLALVNEGFLRSFEKNRLYETDLDLGIDVIDQVEWVSGKPGGSGQGMEWLCQIPSDFEYELDTKLFSPSLLKDAISYGKLLLCDSKDKRKLACVGFAMLEVAQLLDDYLAGGNRVPSLSMLLSVCMNWMRLADPSKPIFLSNVSQSKDNVVFLERDGYPTDLSEFIEPVFTSFRSNFPVEKFVEWEGISHPDELLKKKPVHAEVQIPGSPARIFLGASSHNHANFGLVWPANPAMEPLYQLFVQIMLDAKRRDPCFNFSQAFLLLFEWLRRRPVTSCSHEIGVCIFVALLHSVCGVELEETLPSMPHIEILALISPSFGKFSESVQEKLQIQVGKSLKIGCLPKIGDVMPNWHLRIQALRLIEESNLRM